MLSFISALYNEQNEIDDLLFHVLPYVDGYYIVDDGSTDETVNHLNAWQSHLGDYRRFVYKTVDHIGLPETVKNLALKEVPDGSWVLMLDADERFAEGVLQLIVDKIPSLDEEGITHVYFLQLEIIDDVHVRTFQKCKLFKKEAITFPPTIHEDDQFTGDGKFIQEWVVFHRKTSKKQVQREKEYLETYDKLFEQGKIDEGRLRWLRGLHHFVRE